MSCGQTPFKTIQNYFYRLSITAKWVRRTIRTFIFRLHHNAYHRKTYKRIVFKSGLLNIEKSKTQRCRVISDIITAFVDARWRWTLVYCFVAYMVTWLIFACIWWIIMYLHGDLEPNNLPDASNYKNRTPCVREIYGFTSVFLFSIEIHTTIGYGARSLTTECPEAMLTMCFEGILGTILQSFIVGIVFAKFTRPKSRAHTLLFSRNALINQRDRNLCLLFRVGNIRKARIIAVNVHAYLIRYHTRSGEFLNNEQVKLDLEVDEYKDIVLMFPLSIVHRIDEHSPLYFMSADVLLRTKLEILVVLEGTIESTGQPVQLRSSYTSREIIWGHRFVNLVTFKHDQQGYEVDYSKFESTCQINTPLCSAWELSTYFSSQL